MKKVILVWKTMCCILWACYWRSSRGNIAGCTIKGCMYCFDINIYINDTWRNFVMVWHKREVSMQCSCSLFMWDSNTSASPRGFLLVEYSPDHTTTLCGRYYHSHFACGENRSPVRFRDLAEIVHWGSVRAGSTMPNVLFSPKSTSKWTELCSFGPLWGKWE